MTTVHHQLCKNICPPLLCLIAFKVRVHDENGNNTLENETIYAGWQVQKPPTWDKIKLPILSQLLFSTCNNITDYNLFDLAITETRLEDYFHSHVFCTAIYTEFPGGFSLRPRQKAELCIRKDNGKRFLKTLPDGTILNNLKTLPTLVFDIVGTPIEIIPAETP